MRRELDQAVAGLHHAAANLASLARQYRQYREAADLARELAVPVLVDVGPIELAGPRGQGR
jgi:hypothetical protein